jgi:hypothetical protein
MRDLAHEFDRRLRRTGLKTDEPLSTPPSAAPTKAAAEAPDARIQDIVALAHVDRPAAKARYEALQPELVALLEHKAKAAKANADG